MRKQQEQQQQPYESAVWRAMSTHLEHCVTCRADRECAEYDRLADMTFVPDPDPDEVRS